MFIKKRTAILIFFFFVLIVVLSLPLRGVMVLLDSESLINAKSINGFWWKGNLEKVELNSRLLGDIEIQFLPFSLLKGKASFNTVIKGSEIELKGNIGLTFKGNSFLENINFIVVPQIRNESKKSVFQNISTIKATIEYLYFDNKKCLKARGHGTGELKDVFGIFPQQTGININLTCKKELFEISFTSMDEKILEGEMLIKSNLEFNLEARSRRLSSKIREVSKLNFKKGPSFKISGNLDELMNFY